MSKITDNENQVKRSDAETDIRKRHDRVGCYLKKYLDDFVFVELSDAFLEKADVKNLMKNIPIPLRKTDAEHFKDEQGVNTSLIAENMIWVVGIDPKFTYTEHYIAFLLKLYNQKIIEGILMEGQNAAEKEDFDNACIHFRACLCLKPDYLNGMYGYAMACREMYLKGGTEDYVGNFKAESIDFFELLTEEHPEFAQGYYYLGFAYLNLGLYTKAEITWRQFVDRATDSKDKNEIIERLQQLEAPVKIEAGCNHILAGRYEEGIYKLEPYLNGQFKTWWPLSYYLGMAYSRTGELEKAVQCFKNVLTLHPSHIETMVELAALYKEAGDQENEQKYSKKIELIRSQIYDGQLN
ncbi:tetratricopeptide repeat protein [Aminipila terrae]|uniref:Tetratricopeptide repeat protein n=1 Tax=Aminipila terrae TaxID=2697030 RepID=A0A6P1MG86_9FIRM|nr:tetratricopeptide repeat protein [Aminipila terrae]QHI73062.1 tetratricopeptide repeat protein [Aminipila terrae]